MKVRDLYDDVSERLREVVLKACFDLSLREHCDSLNYALGCLITWGSRQITSSVPDYYVAFASNSYCATTTFILMRILFKLFIYTYVLQKTEMIIIIDCRSREIVYYLHSFASCWASLRKARNMRHKNIIIIGRAELMMLWLQLYIQVSSSLCLSLEELMFQGTSGGLRLIWSFKDDDSRCTVFENGLTDNEHRFRIHQVASKL